MIHLLILALVVGTAGAHEWRDTCYRYPCGPTQLCSPREVPCAPHEIPTRRENDPLLRAEQDEFTKASEIAAKETDCQFADKFRAWGVAFDEEYCRAKADLEGFMAVDKSTPAFISTATKEWVGRIYNPAFGPFEIGLRSDGTVVWRKKP